MHKIFRFIPFEMKKLIKLSLLLTFMVFAASGNIMAQKYGHLNSGNLLVLMPEAQDADTKLTAYREQLVKEVETVYVAWEAKVKKLQDEYAGGTLSQIQVQTRQGELEQERQKILKQDADITDKVNKRREELLKPLIDRINNAINEIGAEGKYTMIFDTSVFNALLYVRDADDIMGEMKKKLNLPD